MQLQFSLIPIIIFLYEPLHLVYVAIFKLILSVFTVIYACFSSPYTSPQYALEFVPLKGRNNIFSYCIT